MRTMSFTRGRGRLIVLALVVLALAYLVSTCRVMPMEIQKGVGIRKGRLHRACPCDSGKTVKRWRIG